MDDSEICVALDMGKETKIWKICKDWSVKTLYDRVAADLRTALADSFNLATEGKVLDTSKFVSDYHFVHLQRIVCTHKIIGGSGLKPLPGFIGVTKEPCALTCDDDPKQMRARMPCGCILSIDAMEAHCSTSISNGACTFHCPCCEEPWEFFLIRHVLSAVKTPEELNAISRKLDVNYARIPQNDIRQCGTCKTYGMRDFSGEWYGSRNRVVCNVCTKKNHGRRVEFCWLCGQRWRGDRECGNPSCGPAAALKILKTCLRKQIGDVKGVPDTRACPKCGMVIYHTEACKHMMCPSCRLDFCFVCLKPRDGFGNWQCGDYDDVCTVAPRQTTLAVYDPSASAGIE